MEKDKRLLTAKDFAESCGWSAARLTQALREGRIKGQKQSGRWLIAASELARVVGPAPPAASLEQDPPASAAAVPQAPHAAPSAAPDYSVDEFSRMTYLTPLGVRQWLKSGRLPASGGPNGELRVDPACLAAPDIKRLLR